jgi:hypothetical protein
VSKGKKRSGQVSEGKKRSGQVSEGKKRSGQVSEGKKKSGQVSEGKNRSCHESKAEESCGQESVEEDIKEEANSGQESNDDWPVCDGTYEEKWFLAHFFVINTAFGHYLPCYKSPNSLGTFLFF